MKSDLLSAPRIAWPTLALLVAALVTWLAGFALVAGGHFYGTLVAALGAYAAFTPLHEAAHRVLARPRWISELAGRVAAIPLTGPFPAVRYLHLEHHKHTNDPDHDPDHYSGRGPRFLLPLRWATQDLHYYALYVRARRPRREQLEVVTTLAGFLAIIGIAVAAGHGTAIVLGWLLPARLAIATLAYAFDYLPHRPHQITAKQDRFAATHATQGRLRLIATFGQSLHLVHHLYPGVPFYRYHRVYRGLER